MAEKINRLLAKWLGVLLLPIFIVAIPLEVAMFGTLVFDLFYFPNLGHISIYPLLLLALSSGTTPWLYLAQKEKTTEALCSAVITEMVFFVVCLVMLFTPIQLLTIFLMLFIGQLLFPLITILAKVHIRKKQGMGIFLYDIILALRGYIHKS